MYPCGWTPEDRYIYCEPVQIENSANPGDFPPPPYDEMSFPPPPPFPPFDPGRPDLGFPYGVFPVFGGFQPIPPPPSPAAEPAAPAPALAATIPSSHVDPSAVGVGNGISYLYPAKHTSLHVVAGSFVPYESPSTEFQFSIVRAPCSMTVAELIQQVGAEGPQDRVTECVELGDGTWAKGTSIAKHEDAAKKTLAEIGWDESRGEGSNRPVWITISRG